MEGTTLEQKPAVTGEEAAASEAQKPRRGTVKAAIVAMRPQEWVKNLLVFAGLLFSARFRDFDAIVDATVTFAADATVAGGKN